MSLYALCKTCNTQLTLKEKPGAKVGAKARLTCPRCGAAQVVELYGDKAAALVRQVNKLMQRLHGLGVNERQP